MAGKKSTQLVIIGVSVFIIGAGLVFVGLHSHGNKPAKTATSSSSASLAGGGTGSGTLVTTQSQGSSLPVSVPIPKGMQAVAVQMDAVPGLAGYVKPGDTIDLYATVKGGPGTPTRSSATTRLAPYARLLLSNVKVLDVSGGTAKSAAANPTFLLALSGQDAEKVIFVAKFESLWASLVPAGQAPEHTRGRDYLSIQ
jgi:Flp pilus assembly protein CpaB